MTTLKAGMSVRFKHPISIADDRTYQIEELIFDELEGTHFAVFTDSDGIAKMDLLIKNPEVKRMK